MSKKIIAFSLITGVAAGCFVMLAIAWLVAQFY